MNSLLNFLNPKKSAAAKAKKSNGFFLEIADDESDDASESHTGAIVPAEPSTVVATQTSESAIVVAESSSIAPAAETVKPGKIKKFRGKAAAIETKDSAPSDVIDAIATVVVAAPKAEPGPANFAPTFLSPALSQTPRRRPGPSLAGFMDMAQQVKNK